MEEFPPLVVRATALARRVGRGQTWKEVDSVGVPSCCVPWVGRLLGVLAAGCHEGRIGEIGTGVGVASAWMVSSMPTDCTLVTIEIDNDMAAHATSLLADDGRVMVLTGDASELLPTCAPYDLLFADGGHQDAASYASLVDLMRIGGQIVMDDVTPMASLRPGSPMRASNAERDFFFGDPRLISTEIVLPDLRNSLLIGTRLT